MSSAQFSRREMKEQIKNVRSILSDEKFYQAIPEDKDKIIRSFTSAVFMRFSDLSTYGSNSFIWVQHGMPAILKMLEILNSLKSNLAEGKPIGPNMKFTCGYSEDPRAGYTAKSLCLYTLDIISQILLKPNTTKNIYKGFDKTEEGQKAIEKQLQSFKHQPIIKAIKEKFPKASWLNWRPIITGLDEATSSIRMGLISDAPITTSGAANTWANKISNVVFGEESIVLYCKKGRGEDEGFCLIIPRTDIAQQKLNEIQSKEAKHTGNAGLSSPAMTMTQLADALTRSAVSPTPAQQVNGASTPSNGTSSVVVSGTAA